MDGAGRPESPPSRVALSSLQQHTRKRTIGLVVYAIAVIAGLAVGVGCGPHPAVLLPEPTAIVKGLILAPDNSRVPAAKVSLEPTPKTPCAGDTFTRVDGSYELDGICPGLYDLVAQGTVAGATLRARIRFIQLSADQTAVLPDLVLAAASQVTGNVQLQGQTGNDGVNVLLVGTQRTATSDASGNFTITNVEQGTYTVNFSKTGFIEQNVSGIAVPPGVTVTVNTSVTLKPVNPATSATIRGQVALETRTDASGVTVSIDGTDRSLITTIGGFYEFDNLPISTYTITMRKKSFFDKSIGPFHLVPGQTLLVNGITQVDAHRVLNTQIPAFDIQAAPPGTQLAHTTANDPTVAEIGLTDPTAQVFNTLLTSGAHVTPFAGIAWSPDTNDLLFVRNFGTATTPSALGTVHSDGTGLRNLLPVATNYLAPAWSPDGSAFAYFLDPNIRTIQVDRSTGSLVATTSTSAIIDTLAGVISFTGMEWGANGRIYYSFEQNTGAGIKSAGIFTIFATGGGKLSITPRTPAGQTISTPESPTLRPDSGRIAFAWRDTPGASEPPNGIYLMDLDGQNATRITTVAGQNLDWSPDGTRIYFTKAATEPVNASRMHEVLVPQ